MNALVARLRALQRQAGSTVVADPASDVRTQLRRMLDRRERGAHRSLLAPAGIEVAAGLYLVERRWPSPSSERVRLPWDDHAEVERERIVCFDTETTGLAGGVGTRAFMIGIAQWQGDAIVARQLYLTTLGGEQAMLGMFASWLRDDAIFVSYNGRSYDAPLLKGRYRLHRKAHPFEERRHVDLLYPVRRRYRGCWANCRLQTVERELLGIVRDDDLPGSEAPAAWLSFLRGQSSVNLARVVEHNHQDVMTLAILLDRLASDTAAPVVAA